MAWHRLSELCISFVFGLAGSVGGRFLLGNFNFSRDCAPPHSALVIWSTWHWAKSPTLLNHGTGVQPCVRFVVILGRTNRAVLFQTPSHLRGHPSPQLLPSNTHAYLPRTRE